MLRLGKKLILLDGGMGSELERMGYGESDPMDLNITHPEAVRAVHRAYAEAGADVITANSFGLNRIKYRGEYSLKALAEAALANARSAGKPVFFDVGPTGALLAPVGTLSFDEAYEAFAEIARLTKELQNAQKQLDNVNAKLANEKFTSKAPQNVIDGVKANGEKLTAKIRLILETLENYK